MGLQELMVERVDSQAGEQINTGENEKEHNAAELVATPAKINKPAVMDNEQPPNPSIIISSPPIPAGIVWKNPLISKNLVHGPGRPPKGPKIPEGEYSWFACATKTNIRKTSKF